MHMLNALDPELISELYHNNDVYRSKYSTL